MKFTPKTEEQINSENLLPNGIYPFEITAAQDTSSKSGNEMIKLTIKVWDAEGDERLIYDYLLESMAFKLRHAAEVCGLIEKYEQGVLTASDFIGKNGAVKISIRKDKTGQYKDQNQVVDYIVQKTTEHGQALPSELARDEIPF